MESTLNSKLVKYECRRCGHRWLPRVINPIKCPACQTQDWRIEENDSEEEI